MSSTYAIVSPALSHLVRKGVVKQASRQAAYHRLAAIVAEAKPADWKALLWEVKRRMDARAARTTDGRIDAAKVEARLVAATSPAPETTPPAETAKDRRNRLAREKRAARRLAS